MYCAFNRIYWKEHFKAKEKEAKYKKYTTLDVLGFTEKVWNSIMERSNRRRKK